MKGKRPYLWVLAAVGLVLWAVPLALYAKGVFLPTVLWIPLYGVGLILFLGSLGTLFWRACLESDPVLRQHDHTVHDERNTAIRGKASAKTLEILRVVLMAAVVWAAAGDSSRQLAVLLFGILLLLSGVEFGCTLYYRRKI